MPGSVISNMSLLSGANGVLRGSARGAPDSPQAAGDLEEGALLKDK